MILDRRTSLMALAALPGLGPVRIRKLDKVIKGGVQCLLQMDEHQCRKWCEPNVVNELNQYRSYFDPHRVSAELQVLGADFVTFEESGYPNGLRHFPDRPIGLYRQRAEVMVPDRSIAIVGTRSPSSYGRSVARRFSAELAGMGFCIVSGLAEGIDTEAHRAALAADGLTLAVLGNGLRCCYPAGNRGLLQAICASAGAWTEFPVWRRADRRSFPQRNRIVAGISEAVVVIESGSTGGSLITARMASEQGKPVYVVPGRIDSPESAGCHALIRDGAQLVTSVDEILQDLNYLPKGLNQTFAEFTGPGRPAIRAEPELEPPASDIWQLLGETPAAHIDRIAGSLKMRAADVSSALLELEIEGLVHRRLDGQFERCW